MCTVVAYRRTLETTGKKKKKKLIHPLFCILKFLQYSHPINTTFKQKRDNTIHPNTIISAPPSLMTKGATPTQPPSYKYAALSNSDTGSCSDVSSPLPDKIRQKNRMRPKDEPPVNPSEEVPQAPLEVQHRKPSPSKRKYKGNNSNIAAAATASSSQRQDPQKAASHTTLIRRVQAVVRIKREESDDDFIEEVSGAAKDEAASDEDQIPSSNQRRSSRRSRKIIKDDEENVDQNYLAADGNPVWDLRHRNGTINYREEDEDDDDVDELMMGAEVNKPGSVYLFFFF